MVCRLQSGAALMVWAAHAALFGLIKLDRLRGLTSVQTAAGLVVRLSTMSTVMGHMQVVLVWVFSTSLSLSLHSLYPSYYEPAATLCLPLLPPIFFILGQSAEEKHGTIQQATK